ncbi:MAG: 5-bromo-4-chloroindolyl phosphate hydrolysis family protein [Gammaproteobacteria bacterium]|nr:5-bromo-4-chloroindolyl phosphate hydrolysis family protein [Gammaproteobacteria bacterium]
MRSESTHALAAADLAAGALRLLSGAKQRLSLWRKRRIGLRGTLLYILAAPLLLAAVAYLATGELVAAAVSAAAFAMIALGARLNRRGMLERLTAPERLFAPVSRFPFQHLALVLVSVGTALAASVAGHSHVGGIVFGLIAAAGFHLAYRLPPARDRGTSARPRIEDAALRSRLQQAEERIVAIERAALSIGNAELEGRLMRIAHHGRALLEQLAQQPDDVFRSRRFLNVHLEGAERVAVGYARTHRLLPGGVLENRFRNVLEQIESAFISQRQQLARKDATDLDVQIEVLRKQLQREGFA